MNGRTTRSAALVLAAGRGARFGGGKLLARLDGRPVLQHVLDLAHAEGLEPVVVVLGADADELTRACRWRNEDIVVNPSPDDGLSSSVRLGLVGLTDTSAERALVLLGDQPWLLPGQLEPLLGASSDRPLVVPRYHGVPGAPVLVDRSAWPLAAELRGDRGFSQLFATHPEHVAYIDVPGTNPDIDTPSDLETAREKGKPVRQRRGS